MGRRKTSSHGRTTDHGWALVDTLVAILALTVLLASVLGGAVVWMRRADAAWRGLMRSIESRNSLVTEYAVGQRDGGHHPR